jgi:hypothetical protein
VACHFSCVFHPYGANVDNGSLVDLEFPTKRVVKGLNQLMLIFQWE